MKKILNDPKEFVNESLEGIYAAHADYLEYAAGDPRCLISRQRRARGKVALCTAGGSGHLPVFLGYVGEGLLDGCAVGNVFASPSASQIYEVTKAVNADAGVLYIYGNYSGDRMNFELASEMAEMDGIKTLHIIAADDVASAAREDRDRRRGVAGLFFAYKAAGAAADEGKSLEEVAEITRRTLENTRTLGVALTPCAIPEVGRPTFQIADDEMEIGMGIHGEPGIRRGKMMAADEITDLITAKILEDLPYKSGDSVAVLINSLGATPKEELYIVYRRAAAILQKADIKIDRRYIGEFATSMEMAGFSVTLLKLDPQIKKYIDAPVFTPFFEQSK